jgi:16S rRNA U516 pseudouridylate synthase RsuA-like enzyme
VEFGTVEEFRTRGAHVYLEDERCAILTIDEGKKRQIRRMFTTLGNNVEHLHRLSTEAMVLSEYDLKPGEFCPVSREDINRALFS